MPRYDVTVVAGRRSSELSEWVLLAYRLPREPSTPRITVWRKLKKLGVVQLVDGLVALPATDRSREQLEWIAGEVDDAGGESWIWSAVPGSKDQQRMLAMRMSDAVAEEYQSIVDEVRVLLSADGRPARRAVERLRRELRRIESRDHFRPRERDLARQAVDEVRVRLEAEQAQVSR